jgi:hypothetical protein
MNIKGAAMNAEQTIVTKLDRGTLYLRSEFLGNYIRVEARNIEITIRPYAQYASAVEVRFVPRGARKVRGFVQTSYPSLVVLEGWDHFEPADAYRPSVVGGKVSAHLCHSEGWSRDFAAELDAYLAGNRAKVAADFRNHNPHSKYAA